MALDRRKHWGWGMESRQPSPAQLRAAAPALAERLGVAHSGVEDPVALEQVALGPPRVQPPARLSPIFDAGTHARASHALGKSYADILNGLRGRFEHPPDAVAEPRSEQELEEVIEWCAASGVAAIPYGGGSSVVGGVTPDVGPGFAGAISIDLSALAGVHEVDPVSRSARIGAGTLGPDLERGLAEHGLTLRHFPQSFEHSTLGGWIATRAGGHFATLWTHIEDLVESARALTPSGAWESRRLPGSGAGPSPDRMLAGSEGILGVITSAWMRVQPRPQHRGSAGVRFAGFLQAAECVREISQSGLHPANCRLIDPAEAALSGAGDGTRALLVLGFESTGAPVEEALAHALGICSEHGGEHTPGARSGDAVGSWRSAFLGAPYVRDMMVAMGLISETFETAVTWERFGGLHEGVTAAVAGALERVCGGGSISCRLTHVYADGPAPYFTVIAPGRRGEEIDQWREIKHAASEAILAAGGTITHHHAVGRDHLPWYERQRPDPFAAALRAAKREIDPTGVMNPGVLLRAPS